MNRVLDWTLLLLCRCVPLLRQNLRQILPQRLLDVSAASTRATRVACGWICGVSDRVLSLCSALCSDKKVKLNDDGSFNCPRHKCASCKLSLTRGKYLMCLRCTNSYHVKRCMPNGAVYKFKSGN